MKSHLSGGPGEYIWDHLLLLFTGRLNKDGTEDQRFTADGRSSFLNDVCKGFNLSSPQRTARILTEPKYNGYIIKGFSLLVDGAVLKPEMWIAKAGEELQKEGIFEILEELSKWKGKERKLKEDTLRTIFKKEINKRGMQNDPEYKKACAKETAIQASELYSPDGLHFPEEHREPEKPKKFIPKISKEEAWKFFIFMIHQNDPVNHRYWGKGFRGPFNRWTKNVFDGWGYEYKHNSNLFIEVMIEEVSWLSLGYKSELVEKRHITNMVKELWEERYGFQDAKGTTKIVVNELFDEDQDFSEFEAIRDKIKHPSKPNFRLNPFRTRNRPPHRTERGERYSEWKAN